MIRRRSIRHLGLGILAVLLALLGQATLQEREYPIDVVLLYGLAVVAFLWAFRAEPSSAYLEQVPETERDAEPPAPMVAAGGPQRRRVKSDHILAGAIALCLLSLVTTEQNGFNLISGVAFIGSVLLGLWAALLGDRESGAKRIAASSPTGPSFPVEVWMIVGLVVLAAVLRWYSLDSVPAGLFYDEAMYGLDARAVLEGRGFPVYFPDNFGRGSLFIYLVAGLFKVFGEHATTLRLASSLLGILTVPAIYLLGKELLGWRVGVIAAFLLAVSRWHINFSRVAFDAIAMPLFQVLAFYFVVRGWRTGRRTDFAWAGLCLGLGLHTYAAFRLVPLLMIIFLVYLWLRSAPSIRRGPAELATAGLLLFLVAAPFLQYAVQHPDVVNNRVQTASVFTDRTLSEGAALALENARKHLLMFNLDGDRNGRHNLPGEPMLDPITAAVFVLGVAYALRHWRNPSCLLLLGWVAMGLSGGVFSLDFEAPQSLRSIGALPAVVLLASLPLWRVWEEADSLSPKGSRRPVVAMAAAALSVVALLNAYTYFVRQANDFAVWNAFSTPESLVAREMRRLGPDWQYYVVSLYLGHPTIRFLAPEFSEAKRFETTDSLPLMEDQSVRLALFLDGERRAVFQDAQTIYPEAAFQEYGLPGAPVVLYSVLLSPRDIASVQGLEARYYLNADWEAEPIAIRQERRWVIDWAEASPLPAPFGVEWSGVLRVPAYGVYTLGVRSPAEIEVWVDESLVLEGSQRVEGQVLLPKGNHTFRFRVNVPERSGQTLLFWRPPDEAMTPVPSTALYVSPVTSNGLLGTYYRSDDWSGPPALQQIDPRLSLFFHNTPLPRPYTVDWRGKLAISQPGVYRLGLECIGDTWLYLNDSLVLEAHVPNTYQESSPIPLTAGLHDLQVKFADRYGHSHINLYWVLPDGRQEIVPTDALFPPRGSYPVVAISPLADRQPVGDLRPTAQRTVAVWGAGGAGNAEFNEPRDLAVDKAGNLYVADTGNHRIVKLNSQGEVIRFWGKQGDGDDEFLEPVAVVLNSHGEVLVMDAKTGWIKKYSADGEFLAKLGGPELALYYPRGMDIDSEDNLYLADTGGSRVLKLSADGLPLGVVGKRGEVQPSLMQPTDVAVAANGDLYAADAELSKVVVFDSSGLPLSQWPIPAAGTYNGQHIAIAPDGSIYITAPNDHLVLHFSPSGELIQQVGGRGDAPGEFDTPVGIYIDEEGSVYVADTLNHRVQKLSP